MITVLLQRWRRGDEAALHELMPMVYAQLHRIAQGALRSQRPDHTLQPTALVNEAYVKLFDNAAPQFEDRAHFLAVLSRVMRQVLIDHARAAAADKRGGREQRVPWDTNIELAQDGGTLQLEIVELDRALEGLEREDPSLARIVEMHYFGGMTAEEVAEVLQRSAHAVRHDLRLARAWLRRELAG